MPFVNSQGVQIHYHVGGEGPPLVLQHGFLGSLLEWTDLAYVEALGRDYRLILVDARGHGFSDKPHDAEAYNERLLAGDVVAVLDDLGVDKAHFFGYSMGGRIGFALAAHVAERFHSFVIGGMTPLARSAESRSVDEQRIQIWEQGMEAFAASMTSFGPEVAGMKERALRGDYAAFIAASRQHSEWGDLIRILRELDVPCLVYAGDADDRAHGSAEESVKEFRNARFVSLPRLDHLRGMSRIDVVLPHVSEFLGQVRANAGG